MDKLNLNTATASEIQDRVLLMGEKRTRVLLSHRPYSNWEDVLEKNPDFKSGMIGTLQKSDIVIEAA